MVGNREIFTPGIDRLEKLVDLAVSYYEREASLYPLLAVPDRAQLSERISAAISSRRIIACSESGDMVSYMLLDEIVDLGDRRIANMPLWGFAAQEGYGSTAVDLLVDLLERTAGEKPVEYRMNIFANDRENIIEWAYCGFGIRRVNTLMPLDHHFGMPQAVSVTYLECDTRFLNRNREEIIDLLSASGARVQHSPMFREHGYMSREQYQELLFAEDTHTIVACRGGVIIGVFILDKPDPELLLSDGMCNLRELFVRPEYRGEGISRGLFRRAISVMNRMESKGLFISCDSADPNSIPLRRGSLEPCFITMTRTVRRQAQTN